MPRKKASNKHRLGMCMVIENRRFLYIFALSLERIERRNNNRNKKLIFSATKKTCLLELQAV